MCCEFTSGLTGGCIRHPQEPIMFRCGRKPLAPIADWSGKRLGTETAYLLKSDAMKRRLSEAKRMLTRHLIENFVRKLGI